MFPNLISSSRKFALRSRLSTAWAASAGRNTARTTEGGRLKTRPQYRKWLGFKKKVWEKKSITSSQETRRLRFVNRTAGVKQQRKSDSSLKRRQKCKKKKKKVSKEGRKIRKPENETKNAEPQWSAPTFLSLKDKGSFEYGLHFRLCKNFEAELGKNRALFTFINNKENHLH